MTANANLVERPEIRIVAVLAHLCNKYERSWCYPSQDKICELLARFHGITLSRRHLNRHINALIAAGYLKTTRRHTKDRHGTLILKSTLYELQGAAWTLIQSFGATLAKLSTLIVHNFNHHAVPKAAQHARHNYLIMKARLQNTRRRFKW